MLECRLRVLPSPLGHGSDVVFQYPLRLGEGLYGFGTRLRATRQFPTHTLGQPVQEAHLGQYKGLCVPEILSKTEFDELVADHRTWDLRAHSKESLDGSPGSPRIKLLAA